MFGLEKGKKGVEKFMFDLERDIHDHPARAKELLHKAEKRVQEIKQTLREGMNEKDFDKFGILLHGYTSLQKTLKKMVG
jgi:hypothetical protein